MNLGGKFWLFMIGGAIACWIGGMAVFLLLEGAWYRWGFLGMLLFISAILLGFGWWYDRRQPKRFRRVRQGADGSARPGDRPVPDSLDVVAFDRGARDEVGEPTLRRSNGTLRKPRKNGAIASRRATKRTSARPVPTGRSRRIPRSRMPGVWPRSAQNPTK